MAAGLPSAILVEIEFTAGAWTDVATLVDGDSIEIAVRNADGGTLDLDLDNSDGRFTPDNPTSTHYPNFVEGKRIRVRVTKSATTYPVFVGRIDSIVPDYPTEPTQSMVHVGAVDLLGDLARIILPSIPEAKARLNTPGTAAFYPLTDPNEHAGMFDLLGVGPRLRIYDRIPGSGRIDAASDDSLGDSNSYVQLFDGKGLWTTAALPSGVTSSPLITVMVKVGTTTFGDVLSMSAGRRDGSNDFVKVRWTSTGFILDVYIASALAASSTAIAAEGGWYRLQVDPVGASLTVTGLDVDTSEVAAAAPAVTLTHITLGGDLDMSVASLLVCDTAGTTYAAYNVITDSTTLANPLSSFASVVNSTGLSASFAWSSVPSVPGAPMHTAGINALSALVSIADSQSGYVYAEPSTSATQTVRLVASADARSSTVALTVDAEGDLDGGPSLARDIADRIASAVASSSAGSVNVVDTGVTDVGAANAYVSTILADDVDLHGVASDRIARGRDKVTRLTDVPVDLATAANDLYAAFFALTLGERLRLSGLPSTYFGVTYIDGYVEGWTYRPGVNGHKVVFELLPADAPPEAVVDDSTYDRVPFGDGVCTLTSTITAGATSISLTFTGSALLSTDAGDYPLDLDLNGERVTIGSAPAGGSSPRTVTVTRGVAPTVARAHTAGEPIDVWLGASIAL